MSGNHKINKVVLDFSFSQKEKHTALQDTRNFFYDKVLPQLNSFFKPSAQHIYIDKLEIDLQQTTAADFENDFIKALSRSFETQLIQAQKKNQAFDNKGNHFDADHILYYLSNGYWTWIYQQYNEEEIAKLLQEFFSNEQRILELLQKPELQQPLSAERLINVVSGNNFLWNALINALLKTHPALSLIAPILPTAWKIKTAGQKKFYFFFTRELIINPPLHRVNEIIILLKKIVTPGMFLNFLTAKKKVATGTKKKAVQKHIEEFSEIELLKIFFAGIDNQQLQKLVVPGLLTEDVEITDQWTDPIKEINESEKIGIDNAGLLLFHPYLVYVFTELKWLTSDKKFANRIAQQKAIFFLQFLINGKSRQAEHQLVLNKLICGWPIHLPLKNSCNLSAAEKAVAADLAESLKEHWTVVKNTSVPGLVQSFVIRPGLIQKTTTGYLVQVERKTIDILLDSLPFSLTIIKFPWNEYIINTEW